MWPLSTPTLASGVSGRKRPLRQRLDAYWPSFIAFRSMLVHQSLGQREARAALAAGLAAAKARGVVVALAVADRTGELIACERMDGAPPRNLKHALRKLFT